MLLNEFAITFLVVAASLVLVLPKRWALLPLFVSACYMTRAQGLLIGPFHFTVIRLILLSGWFRILLRGPHRQGRLDNLDRLMLAWAAWLVTSSLFRDDISGAFIYRLGLVYDVCGLYFLVRAFCQSVDDLIQLFRIIAAVLAPVALAMLYEKVAAFDVFSLLGGVGETPYIRQGHVRAQGPFGHAILAGTIGAVCFPFAFSLWGLKRTIALVGCAACLVMMYASTSSGPVMSLFASLAALVMWKFRHATKKAVWLMIAGYIGLDIVMKDPAYFILARIDITGGSTGWHRAQLIRSTIEHFSEWWLAGTDYTRHWMPTGVSWSPNHTDITNYYIQMGVWAGAPLVALFIAQFVCAFRSVGRIRRRWEHMQVSRHLQFAAWGLGATLFSHAVTCVSVVYFDQSYIFLYLTFAAIASAHSPSFDLRGWTDDVQSATGTAPPAHFAHVS